MNKIQYVFSVFWGNPYTKPSKDLPHKLWESKPLVSSRLTDHELTNRKISKIIQRMRDTGQASYSLGVEFVKDEVPTRKWSDEAKFRNRLKRLRNRVTKRYSIPELCQQEIERLISLKPEYFGIATNQLLPNQE